MWRTLEQRTAGLEAALKSLHRDDGRIRCPWSNTGLSEAYVRYHDEEWGVPVRDDRTQFEFLILEGAQAGSSWSTILNKRAGYREAFADFDAERVARFNKRTVERLMKFPGIVRNRLKIESAITNARCVLAVQDEFGGFAKYLWSFVGRQADRQQALLDQAGPGHEPRSPTRSARRCRSAASSSSAARSCTRTCRRPGWSTTTSAAASATRRRRASGDVAAGRSARALRRYDVRLPSTPVRATRPACRRRHRAQAARGAPAAAA